MSMTNNNIPIFSKVVSRLPGIESGDAVGYKQFGDGTLVMALADAASGYCLDPAKTGKHMVQMAIGYFDVVFGLEEEIPETQIETTLRQAFMRMDECLSRCKEESTIVIYVVKNGVSYGISTGDSRCLVLSEHGIKDLTEAQVNRRLGQGVEPFVFKNANGNNPVLLASDGLIAETSDIVSALEDGDLVSSCENLYECSTQFGHLDDFSVLIAHPG